MKASISVNAETNELIITIPGVDWKAVEHGGFYKGEMTVRDLVNLVGGELTADLMRSQDVDVERLELDGKTYTARRLPPVITRRSMENRLVAKSCLKSWAVGATAQFPLPTPRSASAVD